MTQIIAMISPLPVFEIRAVPSVSDPNHGFYLLSVPRSPRAPHAVPVNESLRYPKRNGSTIRYLSEPEVAEEYRQRAFGSHNQTDRLDGIVGDALGRLDKTDYPWLVVALMPELPGDLVIDSAGLTAIQAQLVGRYPLFFQGSSYMHAGVGRRRYLLGGGQSQDSEKYVAADLHTDGGGAFAAQLGDIRRNQSVGGDDNSVPYLISDEAITEGLISGLLTLGGHARDRAAAGGNVLVRATLVPTGRTIEIGHARSMGFGDSRSSRSWALQPVAPAETSASLDEVASPGIPLVQTARLLADQIGQLFGIAEMKQISADGVIQLRYWKGMEQSSVAAWAKANSLPTSMAT